MTFRRLIETLRVLGLSVEERALRDAVHRETKRIWRRRDGRSNAEWHEAMDDAETRYAAAISARLSRPAALEPDDVLANRIAPTAWAVATQLRRQLRRLARIPQPRVISVREERQ